MVVDRRDAFFLVPVPLTGNKEPRMSRNSIKPTRRRLIGGAIAVAVGGAAMAAGAVLGLKLAFAQKPGRPEKEALKSGSSS